MTAYPALQRWATRLKRVEIDQLPSHMLMLGRPRSGKSKRAQWLIRDQMRKRKKAIVILDPHGSLVRDVFADAVLCDRVEDILIDDMSYNQRVLGYDLIPLPEATDPLEVHLEQERSIDILSQIMCRDQNQDPLTMPIKGGNTKHGLRLVACQTTPRLGWYPYIWSMGEAYAHLRDTCTNEQTLQFWRALEHMPPKDREFNLGPPRRLSDMTLGLPSILTRLSVPPFGFKEHLLANGVLAVAGNRLVPEGAVRIHCGSIFHMVVNLCGQHHAKTGKPLPVEIWMDEALNLKLIQDAEISLLNQCLKWGAEVRIIAHSLDPLATITRPLLQACTLQEYFGMGDWESAMLAANQLGTLTLDPLKTKYIHTSEKTVLEGYTHETHHGQLFQTPVHRHVNEERPEFSGISEQLTMYATTLMKLPVMRYHRRWLDAENNIHVTEKPLTADRLENVWGSSLDTVRKLTNILNLIRSRPPYHVPNLNPPVIPQKPRSAPRQKKRGRGID